MISEVDREKVKRNVRPAGLKQFKMSYQTPMTNETPDLSVAFTLLRTYCNPRLALEERSRSKVNIYPPAF
jgi:hypothetical protein